MKALESLVLFIFLIYFGACIDESLEGEATQVVPEVLSYPNVDRELWTYFRSFEDAAALRGFNVDLSRTNITGEIREIHEENIAGTCSYGGGQPYKDVIIDLSFWNRANSLYREYIVFHELGHCFLFRSHHEACFANGTYESIMRSGNGNCRDNYRLSTRDYYLDELLTPLERP